MEQVQQFLTSAVAAIVRDAPLSPGKVTFAWTAAVGPAIDRATKIRLADAGVLEVCVADQHWRREIRRLSPVILERLAGMLGAGTVTAISVVGGASDAAKRPGARPTGPRRVGVAGAGLRRDEETHQKRNSLQRIQDCNTREGRR
jgi:hypothetical protein